MCLTTTKSNFHDPLANRPQQAGHSRVLCLFLCLPEFVRDLKSSRAFPFVGGRDRIKDILRVVVCPARFGKSVPCSVMASHLGRS